MLGQGPASSSALFAPLVERAKRLQWVVKAVGRAGRQQVVPAVGVSGLQRVVEVGGMAEYVVPHDRAPLV